jgi:hypothetical protein
MDTTTKIAKITALIAEVATQSPYYDYEFEINATLDSCVESLESLLECAKSCPATASSTLTESEGEETQPEQWELKDLTPNVEEEEKEDFEYDDMGVKVKWNKETEGWDALEPYCVECGRPEGDCTDYCTQNCNEEQKHFKHTFYTLAKTDNGKKKEIIKHIKKLLNIKSSNRVDNVIWESDIETYDTLYFDTKKPDNRHIKVDYRDLDKNKHFPNQAYKNIDATYQIEFDVQYKKYSDNNNVWTYL